MVECFPARSADWRGDIPGLVVEEVLRSKLAPLIDSQGGGLLILMGRSNELCNAI